MVRFGPVRIEVRKTSDSVSTTWDLMESLVYDPKLTKPIVPRHSIAIYVYIGVVWGVTVVYTAVPWSVWGGNKRDSLGSQYTPRPKRRLLPRSELKFDFVGNSVAGTVADLLLRPAARGV